MIDFVTPAPDRARAPDSGDGAFGPGVPDAGDLAVLGDAIARLSAHITAATHRLLVLLRRFDEQEGWHAAGFTSCARWLSWRTGIGPGAARERVRVARALGELPALSRAMERGELSYSVARAVTRVATPDNEAELVRTARHATAAQMERLVCTWRRADRAEAAASEPERERARHASRELWLVPDAADGSWVIRGRLDPEVGALLERALEAAGEALYRRDVSAETSVGNRAADEETVSAAGDDDVPPEARRADALGLVAEAALEAGMGTGTGDADGASATVVGRAGRFEVVVHVSAETLAGVETTARVDGGAAGDGDEAGPVSAETPRLEHGPALIAETARRLACDAGRVGMVHGPDGEVLDVGRRSRSVPAALRRALDHRDAGCVFPGCGVRHCDAHHVVPWAEGGETALDNLVLLCRRHHRRVHEEGWTVELEAGEVRVTRPDGRALPRVPPAPELEEPDPVAVLIRAQRELGIDGWTATPRWDGVPMDVDWALGALRGDAWPEDVPEAPGPDGGPARPRQPTLSEADVSAETSAGQAASS